MNKSAKLSLAVIFGGVSSEHEVSRMSVTSILENLSNERYEVHMVGITKEGRWLLYTGPVEDILSGAWEQGPVTPAFLSPDPSVHGLVALRDGKAETIHVDVIFPALHGKNGEDGTIQGLFQLSGIPYVGCDTESSASRPTTCGSTPTASTPPRIPLKIKSRPGWTSPCSLNPPTPAPPWG